MFLTSTSTLFVRFIDVASNVQVSVVPAGFDAEVTVHGAVFGGPCGLRSTIVIKASATPGRSCPLIVIVTELARTMTFGVTEEICGDGPDGGGGPLEVASNWIELVWLRPPVSDTLMS